jgi:N-acetylglucosaminyldiphosphoundecaprenol N-acetyl-beta-D-mannosaminyltransferase
MHRIYQDPKRLWKRYLVNNPKFVYQIALELLGFSKQETA